MQYEYNIVPLTELETGLSQGDVRKFEEKLLTGNINATLYVGPPLYVKINVTVFKFEKSSHALDYFTELKSPPFGTVNHTFDFDVEGLRHPIDLQYRLLTYDFFENCRLQSLKIVSESVLSDGTLSVIYTQCDWWEDVPICRHFFLVIGKTVFTDFRLERLLKLEASIIYGDATYWRPELARTMDYIPSYTISNLSNYHNRRIELSKVLKSESFANGTATVYINTTKNTRYYLIVADKFYSFKSLSDCDIILNKLKAGNPPPFIPGWQEKVVANAKVIKERITRYMNADMFYTTYDPTCVVSPSGCLVMQGA